MVEKAVNQWIKALTFQRKVEGLVESMRASEKDESKKDPGNLA